MDTTLVTITVPSDWVQGLNQQELREALQLGLKQLHRQHSNQPIDEAVVQALRNSRHIGQLTGASTPTYARQEPPILPGPSVSDILIAQRRGEQ